MGRTEAWVALDLIPNIGPVRVKKLLGIFRAPEDILTASAGMLKTTGILSSSQVSAITAGPDREALQRALRVLRDIGARAIGLGDTEYPGNLRQIDDPPVVLYVRGSLSDIDPGVALVGTRAPSHYGRETAFHLARDLSMMGISVISGLARGIDTDAHKGALEGGTKTVAVLGSGIDIVYPPENVGLAEDIARQGAVISEYPPGTHPDTGNFPRRNRIISGLSTGVVVVEAAFRSGALITARLAGEQGRVVMAVPGQNTNVRAQGPHHLIRQGAVLVRDAQDVMMEIAPQVRGVIASAQAESKPGDEIVGLIGGDPLSIDDIARELDLDVVETTKRISMLELTGQIIRVEGNRFQARRTDG